MSTVYGKILLKCVFFQVSKRIADKKKKKTYRPRIAISYTQNIILHIKFDATLLAVITEQYPILKSIFDLTGQVLNLYS